MVCTVKVYGYIISILVPNPTNICLLVAFLDPEARDSWKLILFLGNKNFTHQKLKVFYGWDLEECFEMTGSVKYITSIIHAEVLNPS